MSGFSLLSHRNCWKPRWSCPVLGCVHVVLVLGLSVCLCRHLLLDSLHCCRRVLGLCVLLVSTGAGSWALRIPNPGPLCVCFLWHLVLWPQEGSFHASWELLGSDFWMGQPWNTFCIMLGNILQATGVEGITIDYLVASDRWFPGPQTLLWWIELHWGSQGSLMSNFSHLEKPEKVTLTWNHRSGGAPVQPRGWQSTNVYQVHWLVHLCSQTNMNFGRVEACGTSVEFITGRPWHRFSNSFLCALLDTTAPSLLSPVHVGNFTGLTLASLNFSLNNSNMLSWLSFFFNFKIWLIPYFGILKFPMYCVVRCLSHNKHTTNACISDIPNKHYWWHSWAVRLNKQFCEANQEMTGKGKKTTSVSSP